MSDCGEGALQPDLADWLTVIAAAVAALTTERDCLRAEVARLRAIVGAQGLTDGWIERRVKAGKPERV